MQQKVKNFYKIDVSNSNKLMRLNEDEEENNFKRKKDIHEKSVLQNVMK